MTISRLVTILLLGFAGLFMGCESDVDDMDLDLTPKIVVESFISPQDTLLVVKLQKTQPAIGKKLSLDQLNVKDASVIISHQNDQVTLTYKIEQDWYEASAKSWPIYAGKTYQLQVTTPQGIKLDASCTVPVTTGIEITEIKTARSVAPDYVGNEVHRYDVSFKWRDAPGVANFYRTLAYKQFTLTNYYGGKEVHREGLYLNYNGKDLHNDEKLAGGLFESETLSYYEYNYDRMDRPFYFYTVLVVADRNYYQYHQSLYKQRQSSDNPFAEPAVMFTNVNGGLGVFAGYNQVVSYTVVE